MQEYKDEVLADYATFFKALLPAVQGLVCHDARGKVFWSEVPAAGAPPLTDEYRAVLARVLAGSAPEGDAGRMAMGRCLAYVVPLSGDTGRCLGALTLLLGRDEAAMPYRFVVDLLAPAWRSLERELALRYRLVEGQRKLQVQAAEERLLHKVEQLLHRGLGCDVALGSVLDLCLEHLGITGAFVLLPEKSISLSRGSALGRSEALLLGQTLLDRARAPGFATDRVASQPDCLWVPIHPRGGDTEGVLGLCGWQNSTFSERRLSRVVRYVGSQVESLLDRNYDPLTGLMAWPLLERELQAALAAAGAERHVVLSLDVDQLHVINDTFGREAGDGLLRAFGVMLRELLPGQLASRVNGGNFAALLRDTTVDRARLLAEDLCARFRENALEGAGKTHRATVSIGVGPLSGEESSGVGPAQVACKAAKDRGRARVEVYETADASIVRRLDDIQLVGYVRHAIENNRLALVAQPLMALKPGRVAHYHEVLVRIVGDNGEYMPPGEFMSAAERYQLMEELDRWVVATTLQQLSRYGPHLAGANARFAVNLSGQSLGSDAFLGFVEHAIQTCGVPPEVVAFEITESVAVAKMQQAQNFMHRLKKLGCRFSLDDFGTGLSSFAYLKLFPVDTLKIDGSFVRDITTNVVSQSVVAAIAEVARVMQLDTVAEYVQDQPALDLLRGLNISYAQGYFIGHADRLEAAIATIDADVVSGVQRPVPLTR